MEEKVKKNVTVTKLKNYQIVILLNIYAKLYNIDFVQSEFDDALTIADEGVILENAIKAYGKLEKAITDRGEKVRAEKGYLSVEVLEQIKKDLGELANKFSTLEKPISDTVKKYINRIQVVKPKELQILREIGIY